VPKVKESLRSVYSHKVDRISQIRNSISISLNLLILKQDTPETNRLQKVKSPFILPRTFTAKAFPDIQKFFAQFEHKFVYKVLEGIWFPVFGTG